MEFTHAQPRTHPTRAEWRACSILASVDCPSGSEHRSHPTARFWLSRSERSDLLRLDLVGAETRFHASTRISATQPMHLVCAETTSRRPIRGSRPASGLGQSRDPRFAGHAAAGSEMHAAEPKQGPRSSAFAGRHAGSAASRGDTRLGPICRNVSTRPILDLARWTGARYRSWVKGVVLRRLAHDCLRGTMRVGGTLPTL
jgi:hypothetical protein